MTIPCYEIVTYKVQDPQEADSARAFARSILQHFPGFIDWSAFSGTEDPTQRVDLVLWRSQEEALTAAKAVETLPEFSRFRSSVSSLNSIGHYTTPTEQAPSEPVKIGNGVEIGRFRIKSHVSESDLRQRYRDMVQHHLTHQPGWRSQHLVSLGDGIFVDLAFADDQLHAEAICASWQGQAVCDAFLELIEPLSMEFGVLC